MWNYGFLARTVNSPIPQSPLQLKKMWCHASRSPTQCAVPTLCSTNTLFLLVYTCCTVWWTIPCLNKQYFSYSCQVCNSIYFRLFYCFLVLLFVCFVDFVFLFFCFVLLYSFHIFSFFLMSKDNELIIAWIPRRAHRRLFRILFTTWLCRRCRGI